MGRTLQRSRSRASLQRLCRESFGRSGGKTDVSERRGRMAKTTAAYRSLRERARSKPLFTAQDHRSGIPTTQAELRFAQRDLAHSAALSLLSGGEGRRLFDAAAHLIQAHLLAQRQRSEKSWGFPRQLTALSHCIQSPFRRRPHTWGHQRRKTGPLKRREPR